MTESPCRATPINIMCRVCKTSSETCSIHAVYSSGGKVDDEVKFVGRYSSSPNARLIGGFVGSKTLSGCASGSRFHHRTHLADFMPPPSTNYTGQPTCVTVEAHCFRNPGFCKVNGRQVQQFQMSVKEITPADGECSSRWAEAAEAAANPRNGHKRGHRRRKKRRNRRNKPEPSKAQDASDGERSTPSEICVARITTSSPCGSPTARDFLVHVESASSSPAGDSPIKNADPTTFNPTLAFILGGNEDLSDVESDWDEVDDHDEDFSGASPFGVVLTPLSGGVFSVSVFAGSGPRCPDEGFDDVDGVVHSPSALREVNARWKESYSNVKIAPRDCKVHFPTDDILVAVWTADDIDRKGIWEQAANDRLRFQCRIANAEKVLSPVLSAEHRQKVLLRNSAF